MTYGTIADVFTTEATTMDSKETNDMQAWITVREAAEIAGVSQQWIRFLINEGVIEAMRPGHEWIISRASVEAYKTTRDKPQPQ